MNARIEDRNFWKKLGKESGNILRECLFDVISFGLVLQYLIFANDLFQMFFIPFNRHDSDYKGRRGLQQARGQLVISTIIYFYYQFQMESRKYIEHYRQSMAKNYSDYHRALPYAKLTLAKKVQNGKSTVCIAKQAITLSNQTEKTKKKESKERVHTKKVNYFEIYESKNSRTEHSSLSCSTYKTKGNHGGASREKSKHSSHFNSISHQKSETKFYNKSSIMDFQSNDKKTIKINTNYRNVQMEQLLKRTKVVLDGWAKEKLGWSSEKEVYEGKIQDLYGEITDLKSRINLYEQFRP